MEMTKQSIETDLHRSPFCLLSVSTRDGRSKIVEMAEERALYLDGEACQNAKADLLNPRSRIAAELAWLPGVAPRITEATLSSLAEGSFSVDVYERLAPLARANVMAAASGLMSGREPVSVVASFICSFADTVACVKLEDVLRDINEDRLVARFPEIVGSEAIEQEWTRRCKEYRAALKRLLDNMMPDVLVEAVTLAVERATNQGTQHAPMLLDDLVDTYEVETQVFFDVEAANLQRLCAKALDDAPHGAAAVRLTLDRILEVARNWSSVAKPIQLAFRSRGATHKPSLRLAEELRDLGVTLNNEHRLLDCADRMTRLLKDLFVDLAEFNDKLTEDAEAIEQLRQSAKDKERRDAEWEREIAFDAEVGLMFKDRLTVSRQGVTWKGRQFSLESIKRVRWGGVRRSINGVPTGTEYTVGLAIGSSEQVVMARAI
jgi:hypothetical protein